MSDTPISILFGSDGYELSIKPDLAIPGNTKGLLALGNNAGTAKFLSVDSSGKLIVIGDGVAGTPSSAVFTIQGISGGFPVPISGEISISNLPSTQAVSGTVTVEDGGGSLTIDGSVSVSNFPATQSISGSVSVSNLPTTQAVSGTVTANIGTTNGLALDSTLTDGTQRSKITDGTNNAALSNSTPAGTEQGLIVRNIPSGTQTVAGSVSVSNLPATQTVSGTVSVSNFPATQPVSGTVTSNIGTTNGLALDATLTGGTARARITDGTNNAVLTNTTPVSTAYGLVVRNIPSGTQPISGTVNVQDGGGSLTVDGYVNINNFPATQPVSGTITANIGTTNGLALDATLTNGNQVSKITDGTNIAAVKAASTAAIATDPALVVAISPNSPLSAVVTDPTFSTATVSISFPFAPATLELQNGVASVLIKVSGTWVGVLNFEASFDGNIYSPLKALNLTTKLITLSTISNGSWQVDCAGFKYVRVYAMSFTSGTADVTFLESKNQATIENNSYQYDTALFVSPEPSTIFSDVFSGSLDTNSWQTPVTTTGGSYTINIGALVLTNSTATRASVLLTSNALFNPNGFAPQLFSATIQIESSLVSNVHRFWGLGTVPPTVQASYSTSSVGPLLNAVGFEFDGSLNAVVVSGGIRVFTKAILKPSDGAYHNYYVSYRAGQYIFYIDSLSNPVAVCSATVPADQDLPIHVHLINNTTPPTSIPILRVQSISLSDFGHNNIQISDGNYPWRKTTVDTNGSLQILPGPRNKKKYMCSTLAITPTVTANSTTQCCSLFRSNASTKTVEITRILVNCSAGTGTQTYGIVGDFITAENGTPGGTLRTVQALNRNDASSIVLFRSALTGTPTRVGTDALRLHVQSSQALSVELFKVDDIGAPIVLRGSQNEGFEIRVVVDGTNLTSAPKISIVIYWDEY
jgi:hypothetical protein